MPRFQTQLSAEVPENWTFQEEITLMTEGANVLASSRPLDEPIDVKSYAEGLGKELEQGFPGYRQLAFEEITLPGGRSGWLRRFEHEPEPGRRLIQLQSYHIRGGRVYTTTATAAAEDFERYQQELVSVLTSVDIDPLVGIEGPS